MHGGVLYAVCAHGLHGVFFFLFFLERLHDTTSVPFGFAHDGALGRTRVLGTR